MELKDEPIKFIVHDSNYYIVNCYGKYKIILNSLFINPNSLPSEEQLTTWYTEMQKIIEKINEKYNNLYDMSDLNLNIQSINSSLETLKENSLKLSRFIKNKDINDNTDTTLNLLKNIKEDLIKFNDIEKSTINAIINDKDAEIASNIKKLLLK